MDNFAPTYGNSGTVNIDDLIASDNDVVTRSITLKSGQANLKRGCILGLSSCDTLTPSAGVKPIAGGASTGNATIGAVTGGTLVIPGTYVILFTAATAFSVYDPTGANIGPLGATGTAYVSEHLNFTITAGGTPEVAGDGFTVVVSGTGKYLKCVSTAVDGSAFPMALLAQDTDATAGDTVTVSFENGTFNENPVVAASDATMGTPSVTARVRNFLRNNGIFLKAAYQGT